MLRTVRKLVLGETWALPIGIALAVGTTATASAVAGDWWQHLGGFVLLALLVAGFAVSLIVRR